MTYLTTNHPSIVAGRRRGFTLLEVMFAIMILGIGLIAIASLFPVAGTMQRNAFEDATVLQLSTSIEAAVRAKPIPKDLTTTWKTDGKVHPIYDDELDRSWPAEDRSFPQNMPYLNDNDTGGSSGYGIDDSVDNRSFFWRPFYRYNKDLGPTSDSNAWEIYVIISKHFDGGAAPELHATDAMRQDYWPGRPSSGATIATDLPVHNLGQPVLNIDTGMIGVVTKVRDKNGLVFEVNNNVGSDPDLTNESKWWHAIHPRPDRRRSHGIRMAHNPTLDIIKISGGVK